MRPTLLRLALTAALLVLGTGAVHALTPDDAIYLSQEGVDPEIIIAKICADAEAWDLTAEEIVYLAEQGVSLDVINALIDPVSASEKWGFTLGEPDVYIAEGEEIYAEEGYYPEDGYYIEESGGGSLVFSLGYYYGPLSVHYFSHPYFYPYMYYNGFAFSYLYWPAYYRSYYYPWSCGYYPYPYYAYGSGSYYYGDAYIGYYEHTYYGGGITRSHQVGDIAYRNWNDDRNRKAAYRSNKPPYPEIRDGSGNPGKEQLADGYRSRNDGGRGGERGSRRGDGRFDRLPGDRAIGGKGTLGSGGPVGDVVTVRSGTRRGGDGIAVTPVKRSDRGSKKVDLPNRGRNVERKGSTESGRRAISLGTTGSKKSNVGRTVQGWTKGSTTSKPKKVSSPRRTTSIGKKASGSRKSGSILKPNRSSKSSGTKRISTPSRSKSPKVIKPSKSSSRKSAPKISRSSSKKPSPAKITRSSGKSSRKAPSLKSSSRSSGKSSAKRSSGRGRLGRR
jgi:hypothetical protein